MHNINVEAAAKIIAENVVWAFEHGRHGVGGFKHIERAAAADELMRVLLGVMPTADSAVLATTCNGVLAEIFAAMGLTGPRVEAVDAEDGSVTMRSA